MEITEVKVFPIQEEKLRAFVSIVIDRCFMVNDIKVIQGRDGLFISMPSRRKKNGDFKDIAHPLNNETRRMIEERILTEYEGAVGEPVQRRVHRAESEAVGRRRSAPASCRRRRPRCRRRRAADARRGAGAAPQRLVLDRSLRASRTSSGRSGTVYSRPRARCRHAEPGWRLAHGWRRWAVPGLDGAWPSGKARDFGSRDRRFESSRPSQALPWTQRGPRPRDGSSV